MGSASDEEADVYFAGVSADALEPVPLFEGLGRDDLEEIAQRALFIGAHPGARLVRRGESGFELFIVLEGTADVQVDDEVIARLGPGEVFGEMSLLGGGPRNADVVATSGMSLLTMMIWDLRTTLEEYPVVERRLRELAEQRAS